MKRIGLLLLGLAILALYAGCGKKPKPVAEKPPVTETKPAPKDTTSKMPTGEVKEEAKAEVAFQKIYFDFDKYNIREDAKSPLEQNSRVLKENSGVKIQIEGHCDERGTVEYNLALGDRRANAARQYLLDLGIPAGQISTISYGKERPVAFGHDEASWQQNRRDEFVVTSK